jgi:ABC-2 type transport system permease protein
MGDGLSTRGAPGECAAAFGVLALAAFAFTWLTVAFGLARKSGETATNLPMLLVLLPFLGSGFVPTESMPAGLRWFAVHAADRHRPRPARRQC